MQQRGSNITMDEEPEDNTPQSRNRRNSKLKVLVRSHAMREEQSPPREPTPNQLLSPRIKLTPSPQTSPVSPLHPLVVLSPSLSRGASPCRSSPACVSPTFTLVPSPVNRCSPSCQSPHHPFQPPQHHFSVVEARLDLEKDIGKLNMNNLEKDLRHELSSHYLASNNNRKKYICECTSQECNKCVRPLERNINNNSTNMNNNVLTPNNLTVVRGSVRGKLRQQSSSQGSFEGSSSNSPCLSRDSSAEQYTDASGADLEVFIPETLNRNAKDRALMLRIEQELVGLAKDKSKTHYKFPPMSSYQRMLVHRCAAYFGMEHNIESSGKCVIVNKAKNTRIPEVEFKDHIKDDIVFTDEPRRSILKRDSSSIEDYNFKSPDRQFSLESRRSKSFEEREEEYEKVRRRIFNKEFHNSLSIDDLAWSEMPWSSTDSENSSRYRLHPPDTFRKYGRLLKVQSEEMNETLRPQVSKSNSFGGYGGVSVLSRGDSIMSTHSAGARLIKQDSAASSVSWRLSPLSSGYKSQSQMSDCITPSPSSTPHPLKEFRKDEICYRDKIDKYDTSVVWAVTNIDSVPKGSIIINPHTGEAIKNNDGTIYHYDPNNPPAGLAVNTTSKLSPTAEKISPTSPNRFKPNAMILPVKETSRNSIIPKHNLINSCTSPSLPFSPPLLSNKAFSYADAPIDGLAVSHPQPQYPMYNSGFSVPPPPDPGLQTYQQPYIMYNPSYGPPIQQSFDNRPPLETVASTDVGTSYYVNVQDNASNAANAPLIYQQNPTTYWNQPPALNFYGPPQTAPNVAPNRYSYPLSQSSACLQSIPQNYLSPPSSNQTADILPMYGNQQLQYVYPNGATQPTAVYQNTPSILYPQNPNYSSTIYQTMPQYTQNLTPNNTCASSLSHAYQMPDQPQQNLVNLTQSMGQMNLGLYSYAQPNGALQGYVFNKISSPVDLSRKTGTPKGNNKYNNAKGFLLGSSQSSTGTSSPAATVITGYGPQNPGLFRTPSVTPPTPSQYNYGTNIPSMIFRPASNMRAGTPGTNRSSRSPTPASDMSHFERPRLSIPPTIYPGMPYLFQPEARLIAGRGQPNAYRQMPLPRQHSLGQTSDNRSQKSRKSRTYKPPGLPPNGKQF